MAAEAGDGECWRRRSRLVAAGGGADEFGGGGGGSADAEGRQGRRQRR